MTGFEKGTAKPNDESAWNDVNHVRGFWTNVPLAGHNEVQFPFNEVPFGFPMDNGDGAVSDSSYQWNSNIGGTMDIVNGITAAVLIRPDLFIVDTSIPFFKRRAQPYGAAQGGFNFTGSAGNVWRVSIGDGVATVANTGGAQDPAFLRFDLLLFTHSPTSALFNFYINGQLTSSTATGLGVIASPAAEDFKINGLSPTNGSFPGAIGYVSVWNRVLSEGEIRALYVDPWTQWRETIPAPSDFASAAASALANVGDKNCPWSMPPLGWMNQTTSPTR